jgi:hypothetical protein
MKREKFSELVVRAVTESAAIKEVLPNGAVLWQEDAMARLQERFIANVRKVANDSAVIDEVSKLIIAAANEHVSFKRDAVPKIIGYSALRAMGFQVTMK